MSFYSGVKTLYVVIAVHGPYRLSGFGVEDKFVGTVKKGKADLRMKEQEDSLHQEDERFLSCTSTSKEEFTTKYRKRYCSKARAEALYLLFLTKLEEAISDGNVDSLKKLSNVIDYINDAEDQVNLRDFYDNANNPIKNTNLVILACKHNKLKILEYLLDSNSKILSNLSDNIKRTTILPDDEDEKCHNAFYYAIRSNNIKLLETLIKKWPGNYFAVLFEELDGILSRTYEELKLKNISLSEKMEIFVEDYLINLRFFSSTSRQNIKKKKSGLVIDIRGRIDLVLENIKRLNAEYSNTEKVDEKFLFIAKFIAQNINILKRQMKSTYDRLPWEEMEFCLISFISSRIKQQEINIFYNATLNKIKILNHLENFANIIEGVDIRKYANLPQLKREDIVEKIVKDYPQFGELYSDYQQIRDIHSLDKISDCIKLALSADPKHKEGHLIITRVLQVIGEHLKNTPESPKLSKTTSDLILLSFSKETRQVIIDLRNSLSHADSLFKRTEIEENTDVNFFIGVQNDTKIIDNVITDILYDNKIKIITELFKIIANNESFDEIKQVARIFRNFQFDERYLKKFTEMEHEKVEKLIKEFNNNIADKTDYEKALFDRIDEIINFEKNKSNNITTDFVISYATLKVLADHINDNNIDHNDIRDLKLLANEILKNIPHQIESHNLKEIAELSVQISHSAGLRIEDDNLDKVNRLTCEIFYIVEFGTGDLKWIEELRNRLYEKGSFIPRSEQKKSNNITEDKYNKQLELKLSELNCILSKNTLNGKFTEKLTSYKKNKKLQAVVEMLVLDIMSILDKHLENNLLFLDDSTPLLIGRCLRNHLAHDNALVDILLSNHSIAVILNAKKLIPENLIKNEKKIGKCVRDDISKLKDKFDQNLITITNQKGMFAALLEGNLKDLKSYLRKGADINARSINLWTTLHFAASGASLEIIKFLIDQKMSVNVKDVNGQSPLHVAAAYGRKNIVEFFIKETGVYVDDIDNIGKTSLHIAAINGHKDTVEILLKFNANTNTKDRAFFSPVHYAIRNSHIEVAKILLKKEANVDINESWGGFTSLHLAAEGGYLEIVNFLLENGANVNAKNDRETKPLHIAAGNGHLEVVNALILKGADVNSRAIDGCTPLHHAIENGHENIVNILLKHGANVNVADRIYYNTPLHYAAKDGHEKIVKTLLANEANASVATVKRVTPLHFAVQSGHLEIVAALLDHGVSIRAKDINNSTPLHYAAWEGHKTVAELLIKRGADINDKNKNYITSLHVAARQGHKDMIELLIRNKAEVDCRTNPGLTPLHVAALKGHEDVVAFLIKCKAEVNTKTIDGSTPLHLAVSNCHKDIVTLLIKNEANVNVETIDGCTPLHGAVEVGHKEIVEILIANGANVNDKGKRSIPLLTAIRSYRKDIVEVLIDNGADVNMESGEPLSIAVLAGNRDIVEILLKNNAHIDIKYAEDATLLHWAAERGHKEIVKSLLARGANVDAMTLDKSTPLYYAAQEGHKEVAEILIANRASVNVLNVECAPLHIAAGHGHVNVVEVLLSNGAEVDIKDHKHRTPLELSVRHGHLEVVKKLLQDEKVDINAKCNGDCTILHIASHGSILEMVKYLVDKGPNINSKNASGSKPIHIAARKGYKDTVKFFLSKGLSVNELGTDDQTLLHYAAITGQLEVAKYLISEGADVNAIDRNGVTPLHIAATYGHNNFIEVLLKNGAIYNAVDKLHRRPLEMTDNEHVKNLLESTEELFDSVKRNSSSEVEKYIKSGAFVDAKNTDGGTSLHYAAREGYEGVVKILLQNKADPNVVGRERSTPIHYAAKFSHLKIVKTLLSHGAIYNAVTDTGKTASDFTTDENITRLFKLISESFNKVKEGNTLVIDDLNELKDIDTVKAVMSARNTENKTLIVAAVHSNFLKVKQLKQILQNDLSDQLKLALTLGDQGNYQEALPIFRRVFERRKEILGPDNPGTLDIQTNIAVVLFEQGNYQEALDMLEAIFQKQKEILGLNEEDTLFTRSTIALVLQGQGKDEEAFDIYQEVYQRQNEILGSNHSNTIETQFNMAAVLDRLGEYEEALNINRAVFEKWKETLGENHRRTLNAKSNIAMVLLSQGEYEESLKIYKEVLEKEKIIVGMDHADTLSTLYNIAVILLEQNKYHEALNAFQEVLNIQKNVLQQNHPDTLHTQYQIGNVLFAQGKHISALRVYKETLHPLKAVFGLDHPWVLDIPKKIHIIYTRFKIEGTNVSEVLQCLQKYINIAASEGDKQTIQRLLKDGADANDKDVDGRTPLHYAVSNGHIDIVNILLENGANVNQVTNKGNTLLHTASSKCYKEIVEILLQHISCDKLKDFVDAKTSLSGTTSLHVAAKGGSFGIVKSLLKHGATYNIDNKEGKIPLDLSMDQKVTNLLKLIEELFRDINNGDVESISKLSSVKPDEFLAITNARNNQGKTLLQVATTNKHKHIASKLLKMCNLHH